MTSRGPTAGIRTPFKLQLCQDIRTGALGRRDAQRSHNLPLTHSAMAHQYDPGELNDEEAEASVSCRVEARIGRARGG